MGRFERGLAKERTEAGSESGGPAAASKRDEAGHPGVIDAYVAEHLTAAIDDRLDELGLPPLDWCPICGGTEDADHVCPPPSVELRGISVVDGITLDELVAMDGLR